MSYPKKIAIINQHTSNFGDDAAGVCLIYQLREVFPEAVIEIVYKKKGFQGDLLPIEDVNVVHRSDLFLNEEDLATGIAYALLPRKVFEAFFSGSRVFAHAKALSQMDAVFVSPCGANIGRYRDKLFLFRVLIAVRECGKVLFSLNSIGRSGVFWYDWIAKSVISKTQNFVREKRSYNELRDWGVPVALGVDTAFSMPLELVSSDFPDKEGEFIAFVPTFALKNWHPDFKGKDLSGQFDSIYSSISEVAVKNNIRVVIVPHLHGLEEESEDLLMAAQHLERRGARVSIASHVSTPFTYAGVLSCAKVVVSMRYHGLVLAARTGRPFVGISYENKMLEVAAYCGCPDQVVKLQDVDERKLAALVSDTVADSEALSGKLLRSRARLERLSRLPVDWLASFQSN